jgi:DNA-binding MarR family transcriptional regulator
VSVIDILGKFGQISMGCLSRETFISSSNTTNTVKRNRSADSDREVTVSLTGNGTKIFRKCYPQIPGEANSHMAERLTRKERQDRLRALRKFVA